MINSEACFASPCSCAENVTLDPAQCSHTFSLKSLPAYFTLSHFFFSNLEATCAGGFQFSVPLKYPKKLVRKLIGVAQVRSSQEVHVCQKSHLASSANAQSQSGHGVPWGGGQCRIFSRFCSKPTTLLLKWTAF